MQFEKLVFFNGLGYQKLQQLFTIIAIILAYLFTPLILVILNFLYIYHCLIEIILRIQFKDKFIGFLKGTDCVWANEEAVCFSVINILLIIEKTEQNSNVIFLEGLKNLIHDRIISKATGTLFEKAFYRRRQKFGYYFWERNEEIDLNNRIRWLECENADCDGSCEDVSSEFFRKNLGSICNKTLPDDHTASWEILVGKRCSRGRSRIDGHSAPEECFDTDTCKIPVIIRIHHSLGDGISLLRFCFETILDEDKTKVKIENISINANETNFKELVSPLRNSEKNLTNETRNLNEKIVRSYKKNIFAASMSFTTLSRVLKNLRGHFLVLLKYSKTTTIDSLKRQAKISINHRLNFKDCLKQVYEKIKNIMHLTMIILLTPKCIIKQICNIDKNSLHGPSQTGEKIISYWFDDAIDKSQKLLMKVRKIKRRTKTRFEDVVLTAFSTSIHKYHSRINRPAPDSLTVVLPMRITMPDEYIMFDNNYSIARLRICISRVNGQKISEPNKDSQFFKCLQDITKTNNEFRKSLDILINFWIMKYLFTILPSKILKLFLLSPSTMMFSNIYGPEKFHTLNNYLASNLTFWLPNKGTTALGLSLISYGGNLNLSLIADKSIINDEKALVEILEDTVREINHAYKSVM